MDVTARRDEGVPQHHCELRSSEWKVVVGATLLLVQSTDAFLQREERFVDLGTFDTSVTVIGFDVLSTFRTCKIY